MTNPYALISAPRKPRTMKQPKKELLREHLAIAASEIERLTAENERLRRPWWKRMTWSKK